MTLLGVLFRIEASMHALVLSAQMSPLTQRQLCVIVKHVLAPVTCVSW